MEPETFDDMVKPDERSLRFTPMGLSMRGLLRPEDALAFQKAAVDVELAPNVPQSTKDGFRRLQETHVYGVLSYDLFTVAGGQALLFLEQGLGERFVAFYGGQIPFVSSDGTSIPLSVSTFSQVSEARRAGGIHAKKGVRLQLRTKPTRIAFSGMLGDLLRWARDEGLLHGQRNRRMEQALRKLRNSVAHPDAYHLGSPVDSARHIRDVGEIVNKVWGALTPGGRLYPGPLQREIMAIGWDTEKSATYPTLEQLRDVPRRAGYTFILVRAVRDDESWSWYDSLYETTSLPADLLWGPGASDDALAWADREKPAPDDVEYLDRVFLVQTEKDDVRLPRRPGVAAGLADGDATGTWYAVRADFPGDALGHVRAAVAGDERCAAVGPCTNCPAETVSRGTRADVIASLTATGMQLTPVTPTDVFVPLHPAR